MFRSAAMDAESPTAEHYRKAAKEIRQVTQRSRFRGIGDELFDLAEPCDRMAFIPRRRYRAGMSVCSAAFQP